jgi:hypothetical protein
MLKDLMCAVPHRLRERRTLGVHSAQSYCTRRQSRATVDPGEQRFRHGVYLAPEHVVGQRLAPENQQRQYHS